MNNNMSDDLLVDYLLGEATASQQQQVLQWINASEENKQHFEQLKFVWDESKKTAPGVTINENEKWQEFLAHIEQVPARRVMPLYRDIFKIAAAILLLLGGSWLIYMNTANTQNATIAEETTLPPNSGKNITTRPETVADNRIIAEANNQPAIVSISEKEPATKEIGKYKLREADCQSKRNVCNSTACPIEICIVQKSPCLNGFPVYNCSVIEPDEAGNLCYKAAGEKIYSNCALTVEEIRIKRVETGETIVLNDYTKVTAKDLFSYITGQNEGNIIAGSFNTDCDNEMNINPLTIGNDLGTLLFQ